MSQENGFLQKLIVEGERNKAAKKIVTDVTMRCLEARGITNQEKIESAVQYVLENLYTIVPEERRGATHVMGSSVAGRTGDLTEVTWDREGKIHVETPIGGEAAQSMIDKHTPLDQVLAPLRFYFSSRLSMSEGFQTAIDALLKKGEEKGDILL